MKMLESAYIVGLVDGEGSFTVYVRDPQAVTFRKRRVIADPKFYVKLVARDKHILDELKRHFGCGNVYVQRERRPNHQQCYRYEVANRKDLREVIIPFFRKHELKFPSKRRDFSIFCRLVEMLNRGLHRTPKGLRKVYALKQKMHRFD